jgi:hypothetical protein
MRAVEARPADLALPPSRTAAPVYSSWTVAPFLCASGFCALVYQIGWQREFRLVFGASTAASASVLAIFMGGLGLGGRCLGPRADRHPNPLAFYARLEALVAATAAATPFLLSLVRDAYIALGGTLALGAGMGTVVRLVLAALVLLPPTFLAGGTLGAAACAVEGAGDRRRRATAVLYGVNTLGAVAGCLAARAVRSGWRRSSTSSSRSSRVPGPESRRPRRRVRGTNRSRRAQPAHP